MLRILFPTATEAEPFIDMMRALVKIKIGRRDGVKGLVFGQSVTVVICGMGKANTAQTLTAIAENGPPELVILGGCAGAFVDAGMDVGDVVIATSETYADTGIHGPEGWISLGQAGLAMVEKDGVSHFDEFVVSDAMIRRVKTALDARTFGFNVRYGPMLTVAAVSGTKARGNHLFDTHGALCENMEGAAAAQVAALYGLPFIEVRGISNMVVDRDRAGWDIKRACQNAAEVIAGIVGGVR